MSSLRLKISEAALEDLDEIWLYTYKNWSETQADRYCMLIAQEIEFLCSHPTSGRNYEFVRKGYRASKVKSHLIFYRYSSNDLEVVRILHERMDVNAPFNP